MLLDTLKKVAAQTGQANVPAQLMLGTVKSAQPLIIRVDDRFDISGEAVMLLRELKEGGGAPHTHQVAPHIHAVPGCTTKSAGLHRHDDGGPAGEHAHGIEARDTEERGLTTGMQQNQGLGSGDKVVLLRDQGGQRFLVLGRI